MRIFNFFIIGYLIAMISLFFFSFTQVDLGLTLTEWSVWQVFQKFFQHIGFFQRPFATYWYIATLLSIFVLYCLLLFAIWKKKLTVSQVWKLLMLVSFVLYFSYPAFSYDIYNYIFDAKIVTFYHDNPYTHRALDYAGNPMLGFMHWTQRTYPYGPFWLLATIPLGLLDGFRLLLPTLMLFKAVALVSFLGTAFFIKKILDKIYPQNSLLGLVFFAFNPLVLYESLVSSHNDIFMIVFGIWSLLVLLEKKYLRSFLLLVFSIGVKFATAILIPLYLWIGFYLLKKKKINWDVIFMISIVLMTIAVIAASMRTNFQPWYLLYVLPFAALLAKKYFVLIPGVIVSLFALFEYIPFLYLGNWDPPVPTLLVSIRSIGIGISVFFVAIWFFRNRFVGKA